MSTIVRVENLFKQFGAVQAVQDLSFSVEEGSIYGFLGQNGAGKSTTIRMLLTLIRPDSGKISVFGKDNFQNRKEVLRRTGSLIEKPDLYTYLTAYENLSMMARLTGLRPDRKQLMAQLDRTGLADRWDSKVKTFSQGMKQRLGIACALVHNPDLLILDEPTNGLDPQGIADIRNLMLSLSREEGKTIVLSSHLLHEIELVADTMLIVEKGKKLKEGKVSELLNPAETLVEIKTLDTEKAHRLLSTSPWSERILSNEPLSMRLHRNDVPEVVQWLVARDAKILSVDPHHSLEAYFLNQTRPAQHVAAYKN